ncbi:DUF6382 domain-containing protein [Cohnella massiliensis]|uniref:DUF6382 domain-containing protein n=1 Tax=Cohnella massiliensis TaxID=1816691 RepID=UPI0009BAD554|nr:DUF6382 domain-containing protein [Cohnella massiliensis]
MDGYKIRFERGRGHKMIVEGEPPIGISELDSLQLSMLRACKAPGLLELETEELNGRIALRYALSGRRMLSQALRGGRWTMEEAMSAFCSLADMLENAEDMMLDRERFALTDDFIFIGEQGHDLSFTYLPVLRGAPGGDFSATLERLVVRWLMHVDRPDGLAMKKLLQIAGSADFSPAALRRCSREIAAEGSIAWPEPQSVSSMGQERPARPAAASPHRENIGDASNRGPYADSVARPNGRTVAASEPASVPGGLLKRLKPELQDPQSLSGLLGAENGPEKRNEEKEAMPVGRIRTYAAACAALASALAWRFLYLPSPETRNMALSAGLTLLAFGACAFLWNGLPFWKKERRAAVETASSFDEPFSERESEREMEEGFRPAAREAGGSRFAPFAAPSHRDAEGAGGLAPKRQTGAAGAFSFGLIDRETEERPDSEHRTSWLSGNGAETAMLAELTAEAKAYLCKETDGKQVKFELCGPSVVLGRSGEAAQLIDNTQGVSRAHLELIRQDRLWQAKDLGSRNGSWINGMPMTPYEPYPLKNGDSLQVASSVYRYDES